MPILTPLPDGHAVALPFGFPDPLANHPHPLAKLASSDLQQRLQASAPYPASGQRFGILVVKTATGTLSYLSAFQDQWQNQWLHKDFVPPTFDHQAYDRLQHAIEALKLRHEQQREALLQRLDIPSLSCQLPQYRAHRDTCSALLAGHQQNRKRARKRLRDRLAPDDPQMTELARQSQADRHARQQLGRTLQRSFAIHAARLDEAERALATLEETFNQDLHRLETSRNALLQIQSFDGQSRALDDFFRDRFQPASAGLSPSVKLLHHAITQKLEPVALAEFWWGPSPADDVRYHARHYPCARGSDGQLLPFILQGITCAPPTRFATCMKTEPLPVVYEDDVLLVVEKPAGLLSMPGKEGDDSVLDRMKALLPDATGPLLLHRLDLATSGLLLVAKNALSHKQLQQQFIRRKVHKRYEAVLDGEPEAQNGEIHLPIRVDLDDRPRQRVCDTWGKAALTRWQVVEKHPGRTRVYFYPITGRTHQLRLHAAHPRGLGTPIVGDEIYGFASQRLMLHSGLLGFTHPVTGKWICVASETPF